jgi:hypothetical protein
MKNLFFILAAGALIFSGCDYVDNPHQTGANPGGPGGNGLVRRVLVEEVTGHVCTSCPQATTTLLSIEALYPGRVIPIAIHTGFFAIPCPPGILPNGAPAGSYSEDFNTPEGNEFDVTFPNMSPSPPAAMINRMDYPGIYDKEAGDWASLVDSILAEPIIADLEFDTVIYNQASRALDLTVTGQFINAQNGTFKLVVMVVEDSLSGWQLNAGVNVPGYNFMHVLRGCVNTPGSIFGTEVATGAIAANSTFTYTLPASYTVNAAWQANHCKLVAYIYNTSTMEVLQAAEAKLIE